MTRSPVFPWVIALTCMMVLLVSNGLTATALSVYDEALLKEFDGFGGLLRTDAAALKRIKGLGPAKRAEVVAVLAADLVEARTGKRPLLISTVHSSRFRSAEDRELLEKITPRIDHLIAVSDAIVRKIVAESRDSTSMPKARGNSQ